MSSPPPSNILSDPVSELASALQMNAFGVDPTTTSIVVEESFPITVEDRERIALEAIRTGHIGEGVTAKAKVGLLGAEGAVVIVLDRRGYTLTEATTANGKTYPNQTFESLEALLIGISPSYVSAMTAEIQRRFADHDFGQEEEVEVGDDDAQAAEEVAKQKAAERPAE